MYLFSRIITSSKEVLSIRQYLYRTLKESNLHETSILTIKRNLYTLQTSSLPCFLACLQRPADTRAVLPSVCVRHQTGGINRRVKRNNKLTLSKRRQVNAYYREVQRRLPSVAHRVWILRLAHENSYLSWSRNAAICAGIAATVRVFEGQEHFPVSSQSIMTGFADLGLVFILYGSCHHLYQAYKLRKSLQLTLAEFLWVCAYTSAIGLLYYALIQSKFKVFGNN